MDGAPQISLALPKPGPGLKLVLILVFGFGVFNAILANWVPHGTEVFRALACDVDRVLHWELWRLLSSGLLTDPEHYGHLVFTLMGLYFLAPDLERRWGVGRLLRFFTYAVVAGNLCVLLIGVLTPASGDWRFHPPIVYGATAVIAAIAVAWSRENPDLTVRLFFFVPIRGRWLLWITLGFCMLDLIYPTALPEGVFAPFGGVLVGLVFGGSPSLARATYLQFKLLLLRRRAQSRGVRDVLAPQTLKRQRSSGRALRVLPGGLEDVLRKRTPPKDKRYLN